MRHVANGLVLLAAVVTCGVVPGADVMAGQGADVKISKGWVKAPAPGQTTTTAFAVVENPTMYDVYLVSATADVAGKVEFREKVNGDSAEAQVKKFITVPAYGSVSMDPKSLYLLLTDLKRPLKEADPVSLTLTTDTGAALRVSAVVQKD